MRRYAAFWFRSIKTDWLLNRREDLKDSIFVVYRQSGGRMVVTDCSQLAEAAGLYPGMSLTDARALEPSVIAVQDIDNLAHDLLDNVARWAVRYTPSVMPEVPDKMFLDITGCAHLRGGEHAYLKEIVTRILDKGYRVRGAIADTVGAAWAVARYARENPIVPVGAQRQVLYPLPIAALRLNEKAKVGLKKDGYRTIKALDELPRSSLNHRYGEHVTTRLMQAFGETGEVINPLPYLAEYKHRLACPEGIMTYEGIAEGLNLLLADLCERLEFEGKGARELILECFRFDGETRRVSIGTTFASRDQKHLFGLFDNKLSLIEPGSGIEAFTLTAPTVEKLGVTQENLLSTGPVPDKVVLQLADRIASKFGRDPIFSYRPVERHWPERSVQSGKVAIHPALSWPALRRPVRLLARPEPIQVMSPLPDYPPIAFSHQGTRYRVRKADGPERIETEWWLENGEARDYYCVEDENGARYWLFRAGLVQPNHPPQWFLHGFFA